MESLLRRVEALELSLDNVPSGRPPLLVVMGQPRSDLTAPPLPPPPLSPSTHLGWLGWSKERPCMSRLRARGLGTGRGAFAFLHQMAKPPMSLDGEGEEGCSGPRQSQG